MIFVALHVYDCIRIFIQIERERERVYLCILQINYHVQGRYQQTNANVSGKKSWLIYVDIMDNRK